MYIENIAIVYGIRSNKFPAWIGRVAYINGNKDGYFNVLMLF